MDPRLRLQAEFKDNATPKVRQLGKELKEIRRSPGMEQAQKWFSGFNETAESFVKGGGAVAGAMGAIGVGGLTAAASLAGLVKQFKDLGDHTFALKRLGQESGLTIDQLRQWEYVGQIFRVPVEQMDAAFKQFADKMMWFRQRRGELFGQLNQVDGAEATKLLGMKDANAQFEEILRWLSTIKDAAKRNQWAKEFFGGDELNSLLTNGLSELEKALAKARAKVAPVTPDMLAQADALADAIVDLNQSWENFELTVGPAFLKEVTAIVHEVESIFAAFQKSPADAAKGWLEDQERQNEEARKKGDGPVIDLPGLALDLKRWWEGKAAPKASPYGALDTNAFGNLGHKTAFSGSGGLMNLAAFRPGGSDDPIAGGVKEGVLAAFREWAAESDTTPKARGAPGLVQASYHEDDGSLGARLGGSRGSGGTGLPARRNGGDEGTLDLRGFGGRSRPGTWWTADRQAHAVDRLTKEAGLSQVGAEGLVSRWANVEAGAGPTAFNPHSGALGIGQWLGSRKHGFTVDYDSQLSHAIKELNGPERAAGNALRAARDARAAAIGASRFERAEHFHPGSGIDDWTGKSLAGAERVHREVEEARRRVPSLVDEARKAAAPPAGTTDGSIEAHVHIHDGQVRGAHARSTGVVAPPRVHLRRGPTMTEPSIST